MTLQDTVHGPAWIFWAVAAVFALNAAILLSGRGSGLIAGFNMASQEVKDLYNVKKLCRVMGTGMAVIAVMLIVMAAFADRLPVWFAYVFLGVTLADAGLMVLLSNTVCKKK